MDVDSRPLATESVRRTMGRHGSVGASPTKHPDQLRDGMIAEKDRGEENVPHRTKEPIVNFLEVSPT